MSNNSKENANCYVTVPVAHKSMIIVGVVILVILLLMIASAVSIAVCMISKYKTDSQLRVYKETYEQVLGRNLTVDEFTDLSPSTMMDQITQELEKKLTAQLTEQLTAQLTAQLRTELEESLGDQLRTEFEAEWAANGHAPTRPDSTSPEHYQAVLTMLILDEFFVLQNEDEKKLAELWNFKVVDQELWKEMIHQVYSVDEELISNQLSLGHLLIVLQHHHTDSVNLEVVNAWLDSLSDADNPSQDRLLSGWEVTGVKNGPALG